MVPNRQNEPFSRPKMSIQRPKPYLENFFFLHPKLSVSKKEKKPFCVGCRGEQKKERVNPLFFFARQKLLFATLCCSLQKKERNFFSKTLFALSTTINKTHGNYFWKKNKKMWKKKKLLFSRHKKGKDKGKGNWCEEKTFFAVFSVLCCFRKSSGKFFQRVVFGSDYWENNFSIG